MSDEFNAGTPARDHRLLAGRYRLFDKIGEGGAAEVFRARDERLDRLVAIKLLRPQFTYDEASRTRFINEARAAARLSHPNIVDVYDFGETEDGTMFIAMQYIEGQSLKDILRKRGRLSAGEAVAMAIQACHALSAAHSQGLVHRDVKPQNILVDRGGNAHLTDFGIVKALSGPALTQSGMTFGTAAYMSPEQATGGPVGPESDIYSLGCVLYEMLAGRPPFDGDNPAVVAYKQVWEEPVPLHMLVPEVPPSLERVVMRCLSKDPGRRYPSTRDLAADLERLRASFNQPTQVVSLGAVAAEEAAKGRWVPAEARSPAELSQPVPMPGVASNPTVPVSQPRPVPARPRPVVNGTPVPVSAPSVSSASASASVPPARPATVPYTGQSLPPVPTAGAPALPVVDVSERRGLGWLPAVLALLAGLVLCAFALWQGQGFSGIIGGEPGTPTAVPSPTTRSGGVVVVTITATATATATVPAATPTATATATAIATPTLALTETPQPTPEPPTPTPASAPTDTPAPEASPTPEIAPTDTPVQPPAGGEVRITLEDSAFTGGYTRSNGRYHDVTARWVYGQGTSYHTMSATFDVDSPPAGTASLLIRGLDDEAPGKQPIRITLNAVVIYEGDDPLPDDFKTGPDGPGNWGEAVWDIPAGTLQPGPNTLTITNLGPGDRINYPAFFMLDYAIISWSAGGEGMLLSGEPVTEGVAGQQTSLAGSVEPLPVSEGAGRQHRGRAKGKETRGKDR